MLLQSLFLILHPSVPSVKPFVQQAYPIQPAVTAPIPGESLWVSLSLCPTAACPPLLESHGHPLRDPTFFKAGVSLKLRRITGVSPPRSLIPLSHLLRALEMGFSVNRKHDHFHSAPRVILGRGSCYGSFLLINRLNWAIQVLRADKGLLPFLR